MPNENSNTSKSCNRIVPRSRVHCETQSIAVSTQLASSLAGDAEFDRQLRDDLELANRKVAELTRDHQVAIDEIRNLQATNQRLEAAAGQAHRDAEKMRGERASLQSMLDQGIESGRVVTGDAAEEVLDLRRELDRVRREASEFAADREQAVVELRSAHRRIEELQSRSLLSEANPETDGIIAELRSVVAEHEAAVVQLQGEVADHEASLKKQRSERRSMSQAARKAEDRIAELEAELASTERKLKRASGTTAAKKKSTTKSVAPKKKAAKKKTTKKRATRVSKNGSKKKAATKAKK